MGKKQNKKSTNPTRRQVLGMVGSALFTPALSQPVRVLLASLVDGIVKISSDGRH